MKAPARYIQMTSQKLCLAIIKNGVLVPIGRLASFGATVIILMLAIFATDSVAQEGYVVRKLDLSGNRTLSDDQLKTRMATYATGKLRQKIFRKEPFYYSADILSSDLQRLVRLYQREGFLYAKAELESVKGDVKGQTIRLAIKITEGDSITVRNVRREIDDTSTSTVRAVERALGEPREPWMSVAGKRFRDADIEADRQAMALSLENIGYPYCEITPQITVDENERAVDILWEINPGPRCEFGEISVVGNALISGELIEDRLALDKGDTYSRSALEKSQRSVYDLSVFHVVTVTAQLTSVRDTVVPVKVRIVEAPRLTSKFGVGYGREEKFRVYSDSYLIAFLGGARRLNFYAKHSSLEPYHFSLRLIQPGFLSNHMTLEIQPFVLRQEEPAFSENRYGGNLSLRREFSRYLRGSLTYSLERVNLDTNSVADLTLFEGELADAYNKSSLMPAVTFDNSSPMFSPSRGFYGAVASKISGLGLGSKYHFTRLLGDVRRYQPVLGMVLAGKVKAGGIRSNDEHGFIPPEDRFYAGGSASVRGWARAKLGPLADDGTPLGGNSLFEASVALRFPIIGILSGSVFSDFGNVWVDSYSFHLDDLRYSAGCGIRIKTPIGPVRFDAARPVSDVDTEWQLHISVGEAF